jgi:GxxExxY protein
LVSSVNSPMHADFLKADLLSKRVIGAAIEVHREMGPGLIESIYEKCLTRELELQGILTKGQVAVPVEYKGYAFQEMLRLDMLIEDCLLLELKCVEQIRPIHKAQLLSYMKLLNAPIGLLLNFHEVRMRDGVKRMILPGANHNKEGNEGEVKS